MAIDPMRAEPSKRVEPIPAKPRYIRDLVYGVSGSGKTSWWIRMAEFLWRTKGLKSRWYLGDGGGETIFASGADEFIEVMPYNLWDHPLSTTQRICEGYWPADPAVPNSPLFPTPLEHWAELGLVVYEGLTAAADYIMGDREGGLAARMAKGEAINNDASFRMKDGDLLFGGNSRTHYGFAQRRILDLIERTRALPVHVGWTAHERKVEDEDYKELWIGPDIAGKALTTKIGASFGNTIHLHKVKAKVVTKEIDAATKKPVEQVQLVHRAYTRAHYDPEQTHFVRYFANTRIPRLVAERRPDLMPEFIAEADPVTYYTKLQDATAEHKRLVDMSFSDSTLTSL